MSRATGRHRATSRWLQLRKASHVSCMLFLVIVTAGMGASTSAFAAAPGAGATLQDSNILEPIPTIEQRLRAEEFEVLSTQTSRGLPEERTYRATLRFGDGTMTIAKWAPAPFGGEAFNNRPRYELAVYELQKLFLEEDEYVVPPTVARCLPLERYREVDRWADPTFRGIDQVLLVLQYWLWNVRGGEVLDEDRFAWDTVYARHLGNLNILSYLVRHYDSNEGNFLMSSDPTNPRVFAVDNGLAFASERSDRGIDWSRLRVERLPSRTVERLRALDEDTLQRALGVVAEFRLDDESGHLVPAAPSPNLDPGRGTRWVPGLGVLQLGLTEREIRGVHDRLRKLLEEVDEGEVALF